MKNTLRSTLLSAALLLTSSQAFALTFTLPANGDSVVGHVQITQALPGDSFSSIGRRYDIGYYQLVEANPGVDPLNPPAGTLLVIPTRFVLPPVERKGIVVNLAELRIYFYPPNSNKVMTFPIGIGREGWNTPTGLSQITQKTANPTWVVPASIMKDRKEAGVDLPKSVPPGPDNPLGAYRMRLTQPTYLIHGTNDYRGVGRRSSSGCIRMFPEDVETLFSRVKVGTQVHTIDAAYKAGWGDSKLYLEAHVPLQEQQVTKSVNMGGMENVVNTAARGNTAQINWDAAKQIAKAQNGVPQVIE